MNRVHIVGASGSGTTTLGAALARDRGLRHYDTDDYYWKTKYTEAAPVAVRLETLGRDLTGDQWVLSGSLAGWGDPLVPLFDLVVFVYLDPTLRLERLVERERCRYGDAIAPGGPLADEHQAFVAWARQYDHADETMRSLRRHEAWLAQLPCAVLRLRGEWELAQKVALVRQGLGPSVGG